MTPTREEQAALEVAVEERGAWQRRLTVTVGQERVARARAEERRKLAGDVKLKGFRKGKVPQQIVEQRYGPVIDERTVRRLVEQAYREAVRGQELHPISDPSFGEVSYEPGQSLTFQADFEIMPALRLERVGGFRVSRPEVTVSESEVDEVLERLRADHARWEPVEGPAEEGDMVSVRITRLEDEGASAESDVIEEAPDGGRAYRLELGAGYAIPDVEDAIRSLQPGEAGEFDVRFPEDFDDEEVAGQTRRLRVELVEVKRKHLPPVDEEFATEVGDFDSLQGLRDAVREDLHRHEEEEAERTVRDGLVDSVIEANPFEVPRTLVENYLDRVIDAPEGADPERVEQARQSLREAAERQIKRHLVLDRLAEREGLGASEEELGARLEELAARRGTDARKLRRQLRRENRLQSLREQIAAEKVYDYLKSQSEIG